MKTLLLSFVAMCCVALMLAVPARRTLMNYTQPDGSSIQVRLVGDEHAHYYETVDGRPMQMQPDGRLAQISQDELKALLDAGQVRRDAVNRVREERMQQRRAKMAFGEPNPIIGQKKGLVILVNFEDKAMKSAHTQEVFHNMFNQVGYNRDGHVGSVHDYFYDQSYGLFDLEFDVVGPVTVSQGYSYYGHNRGSSGDDEHPCEMVIEALHMADSLVNYADYDWDGDGFVDQVYCIYAGYGEAGGGSASTIWPHEWHLSAGEYYGDGTGMQHLDGVYLDTYAVSCELSGSYGSTLDGIGTACHEFSHCLGYPDFYDTSYSGGIGMGCYDVLDGGCYNGPNGRGEIPCGYTSYERWIGGWLEPTELKDPCTVVDMPSVADSARAYILYNEKNRNEYYLLENRRATDKWFQYYHTGYVVKASDFDIQGMFVLHVDYDASAWAANTPNRQANHQRMSFFCADNAYGSYPNGTQLAGDMYPGRSKNRSLTDTSKPAASLFNANKDGRKFMGHPIEDIEETNGKISFKFDGGVQVQAPVVELDSAFILEDGFSIYWGPDERAKSYTVRLDQTEIYVDTTVQTLLQEDMAGMIAANDGSTDIASSLNNYMSVPGWKGSRVYRGRYGAKIGAVKTAGYILSPIVDLEGEVIVNLSLMGYNAEDRTVKVAIVNTSNQELESYTIQATDTVQIQTLTFTQGESEGRVHVAPSKRAYLNSIEVVKKPMAKTETSEFQTTDTSMSFSNLAAGYRYVASVCVNTAYGSSDWSEPVEVVLDVIEDIETLVQSTDSVTGRCYDLQGRVVSADAKGFIVRDGKIIINQ